MATDLQTNMYITVFVDNRRDGRAEPLSSSSERYTMSKTPSLKVNKCVLVPVIA